MPFGKIEQYDINSHNWDAYVRRIKQFIMLNGIKEDLHVAALVTHVGVTCYELMCDLCALKLPEEKSFMELIQIVKEHLEPQRSEIAERHVFRQRKQQQSETISEYLQVLKHLAKTCNFSNMLEVNLRDQFVSGLCSEDMRSRLFAEKNIDYKRAVELALALELAGCYNVREVDPVVDRLRNEFPEVFAGGLGTFKSRMQFHLADETPIFVKARPLPLALRARVESELERLQLEDVTCKVERSDYGTPIVPVVKANGDIRICGDYKITINPRLKEYHYPLPRIDDIFATLGGGQQYSKLDLSHAYQQVLLKENSQPMTAITTHLGTFIYKRVPFGIKCVPENFQKMMEETFGGMPSTVVFQDDICCTGKDRETHLKNLKAVLYKLKENGLRLNWNKCQFFQNTVTYLGYRIDKNGLHTDEKKVQAIMAAPIPLNVTQLKSFLGLVNFYSKFFANMSDVPKPLYNLLKKNIKWVWSDKCQSSFKHIKTVLSTDPVLAHYNASLPLILSVDSSSYGLGAVLSQREMSHAGRPAAERAISCASRTLNSHELNYSQFDKEALAIVFEISKHHQYLYGRHFTLRSDHRALSYIFGKNKGIPQTAASRLQRYAVLLSAYKFDIEFITSANNCYADALSRLPLKFEEEQKTCRDNFGYLNYIEENFPITFHEVRAETSKDVLLNKIVGFIKFGWPSITEISKEKPFFLRKENLYLEHGCVVWGYRVVIPKSLCTAVLRELHDGHPGIVKMKQIARNYFWWSGLDSDIERVSRECAACRLLADRPAPAPLYSWEWPVEPWSRLNIDFLGPFRSKYYLVLVDAHSKWIEAEPVNSLSAQVVISCLRKLFSRFGLPRRIVSDNGPPFSSSEYGKYLERNGIKRILVAPYHPSSNGAAENAVRSIKNVLKKAVAEGEDLETAVSKFLFSYRNTEHSTTKKEPSVALVGRRLRGRLDLLRPETKELVRVQQMQAEARRGGVLREASVGDAVRVRDYASGVTKWTDGTVQRRTGPVSYVIKTNDDRICRRHVDQILTTRKSHHSLARVDDEREHTNDNDCLSTPTQGSPVSTQGIYEPDIDKDLGEAETGTMPVHVDRQTADEVAVVSPTSSKDNVVGSQRTNTRQYQNKNDAPHSMVLRSRNKK